MPAGRAFGSNAKLPTIGKTVDDALATSRDNLRLKSVPPKDYARQAD
jgi:hypothetical protein